MKQTINKKFLVNSCIVFSGVRNEDGDNVYYVSQVSDVVRTQSENRFNVSTEGLTVGNNDVCLFDAIASISENKTYCDRKTFENSTDEQRLTLWTLRGDDSIFIFKTGATIPSIDYSVAMSEVDFRTLTNTLDIKKIKTLKETQNFIGDIVVREIEISE